MAGERDLRERWRTERQRSRRVVLSIAVSLALVFLAILFGGWLAERGRPLAAVIAVLELLLVLACCAGVGLLGSGAARASLAGPADLRSLGLGLAGGLAAFCLNALYLLAVFSLLDLESVAEPAANPFVALLIGAVLPALVEEWLCRGVLWEASRPAAGALGTVFLTAALFALLHALNGAGGLELPHRFVTGLILGWLRLSTGSLAPCVLAHFVNNALALGAP
jgi:hypothetical protein